LGALPPNPFLKRIMTTYLEDTYDPVSLEQLITSQTLVETMSNDVPEMTTILVCLDNKSRLVITMRCGLNCPKQTPAVISSTTGITIMRVYNILNNAMRKLRSLYISGQMNITR